MGPTASFVKSSLIPSTAALLTRHRSNKKKARTQLWNEKEGGKQWTTAQKNALVDGYDQVNKHITKKRSVTSLDGILALDKLSSKMRQMELLSQVPL